MSKIWVGVLAFAGGVFVGIQIAKEYAKSVIADDIHKTGIGNIPIIGGALETVADKVIVPQ